MSHRNDQQSVVVRLPKSGCEILRTSGGVESRAALIPNPEKCFCVAVEAAGGGAAAAAAEEEVVAAAEEEATEEAAL